MEQKIRPHAQKFSFLVAGGFVFILLAGFFLGIEALWAFTAAYLLSTLFVGSNFLVIRGLDTDDHKQFNRVFFISIAVRFLLVTAALVFILGATEIHQIYFTVSFIISYIFHSVNEIIFINKILETR